MIIGRVRLLEIFAYSESSGILTWKIKPSSRTLAGSKCGRPNTTGYLQTKVDGNLFLNHRLIFLMCKGFLPRFLDHIDGDKLNNRIQNLRECNLSENNSNRKKSTRNTSGTKGLFWCKVRRKWRPKIVYKGKHYHLGSFDDPEVASQVLRIERLRLHGEFANHGQRDK